MYAIILVFFPFPQDAAKEAAEEESLVTDTYVAKSIKASFDATATERFTDALASLDYMLLREAPRVWSAVSFFSCFLFLLYYFIIGVQRFGPVLIFFLVIILIWG